MTITRSSAIAMFLIITLTLSAAMAVSPAILQDMPADSQAVVATIALAELSAKADLFARKIGIASEKPINLEEMLATELGISGMIDGSRGAGLSIGGPNLMSAPQTMVGFLPVKDAQAAIKMLRDAGATAAPGAEGVYTTVTGIAFKASGKYLLLAAMPQALATVEQRPKGVKLSPAKKTIFGSADVAITADVGSTLPMLQGMMMMPLMSDPQLQQHPSLMSIVQMSLARLAELESITLGGGILAEGVGLDMHLGAKPGTALANFLNNHPTTDLTPLKALPNTTFLQAMALSIDAKAILKPVYAVVDALAGDATLAANVNADDVQELKQLLSKMYGLVGPFGMAEYAPNAGTGAAATPIGTVAVGNMGNFAEYLKLAQKFCPLATKVIAQFGYTVDIAYTTGAGKVDGISYDQVAFDISKLPLPPAAMQAMMAGGLGSGVVTKQFCKVKKNLFAAGIGEGALTQAVALVKNTPAGLDQHASIVQSAKQLPDKANVFFFLDAGQTLAQSMAGNPQMQMMAPMFSTIKGTVAGAVTMTDGSCGMRAFVPSEVVQGGVMIVQQFMAMMTMMQTPPPTAQPAPAP